MKGVAVLQARTSSSRLPGKVLLPINNIPIALLAAKRAGNTGRKVIVATSREKSDDALAAIVQSAGLPCARSSLENVLQRFVEALHDYEDETIVFRLTADNVFPDGALLDEMEQDFVDRKLEYLCCNGEPSGLPYGLSAEVTRLGHLREAERESKDAFDREHVTPYVIRKFGANYFEKYKSAKKGHFRCTIDCLDDYICAAEVFSDIKDPVAAPFLDLVNGLQARRYQPIEKEPVPRLVLGTAQLGMNYGIANKAGMPDLMASQEIIKTAVGNGVVFLDTARAYGQSEEVIGRFLKDGWKGRVKIITKLSPLSECSQELPPALIKPFVDASIFRSCAALGVQQLDVLMLHRAVHLDEWNGAVWQRLLEQKAAGYVNELGVSVQSPRELERALAEPDVSFIQMPFNILDWRWDGIIPQILEARSKRKLIIHVRSVLLQGLLTCMDASKWVSANMGSPDEVIQWLRSQSESCDRISVADLCVSYVAAQNWVDGLVMGMENMEQLIDNIRLLNRKPLSGAQVAAIRSERPGLLETTLNPAFWRTP